MVITEKDILEWDVNSWKSALTLWKQHIENKGLALELGARHGGISLWLASEGYYVVCSDVENDFEAAKLLHKKLKNSDKISYKEIDATNINESNKYDIIIFKSILGTLGKNNQSDKQKQVFQEIYNALKPGGKLLFAENLKAGFIHQFFRKYFTRWGSYWRYVSYEEILQFSFQFKQIYIGTTGFIASFGRTEKQRKWLSYADMYFFNFIIPLRYKYIVFGVLEK